MSVVCCLLSVATILSRFLLNQDVTTFTGLLLDGYLRFFLSTMSTYTIRLHLFTHFPLSNISGGSDDPY
jgi:hypothetical protein